MPQNIIQRYLYQAITEEDLEILVEYLKENSWLSHINLLTGDLGAGKTTMVKYIMKSLQCTEEVTSPTYALVNEYEIPKGKVYHMDLYRIKDEDELLNMGIEEYWESADYNFIEWPDIAQDVLPSNLTHINIKKTDNNHRLIIVSKIGLL